MTYVTFKIEDEEGNLLSGINVTGKSSWGLIFTMGSSSYNVNTNPSGVAAFDPGNGPTGGSFGWTATGTGYTTLKGSTTLPPFTNNVTQNITLQKVNVAPTGSTPTPGSVPITKSPVPSEIEKALAGAGSNIEVIVIVLVVIIVIGVVAYTFVGGGSVNPVAMIKKIGRKAGRLVKGGRR